MSILLLLGNNANYLGHSITQMEKSLNWNHSLYKIYCAEKFDNNLTTKNKEYNTTYMKRNEKNILLHLVLDFFLYTTG